MKHRWSKERARETREFVYKYREDVGSLDPSESWKTELGRRLIHLARTELGYSATTADYDILANLKRQYNKLIK